MMKINYWKWGKLAVGAIIACVIAGALGLQYSLAAGIITLLSIQDTKKETLVIVWKRILIFLVMTGLSLLIFPMTGFSLVGFGVILIPYLWICLALKMPEAIAPIAVLCTHYMTAKSCSLDMILNEFGILCIGAGVGVLLNLFMPDNRHKLLAFQKETDERIIRILQRMSEYLLIQDKSDYTGSCFAELEAVLHSLHKESVIYMSNHVIDPDDYFLRYMNMRTRQCNRLKQMYEDVISVHVIVEEADPISQFLEKISLEFSEENDVEELLQEMDALIKSYRTTALPTSREEFEARAILFELLSNIKAFLEIKRDFVMGK